MRYKTIYKTYSFPGEVDVFLNEQLDAGRELVSFSGYYFIFKEVGE